MAHGALSPGVQAPVPPDELLAPPLEELPDAPLDAPLPLLPDEPPLDVAAPLLLLLPTVPEDAPWPLEPLELPSTPPFVSESPPHAAAAPAMQTESATPQTVRCKLMASLHSRAPPPCNHECSNLEPASPTLASAQSGRPRSFTALSRRIARRSVGSFSVRISTFARGIAWW